MGIELHPPLDLLADRIRRAGSHDAARLSLLKRAEEILSGRFDAPPADRRHLADQLERWRYTHLDTAPDHPNAPDRQTADTLDQVANQLAQRAARPPRCPRGAVDDPTFQADRVARAMACLDPARPLRQVTAEATALTESHFSRDHGRTSTQCGARHSRDVQSEASAQATSEHVAGCPATSRQPRRRMLLYAPLYLSSLCVNHCTYCGFRSPRDVPRRHLSRKEAIEQAEILRRRGFRHILLVAGDYPRLTTTQYFAEVVRALADRGISPAVEIAPQSTSSYAQLVAAGCCGVTLYQETYDPPRYRSVHPRGTKVSYDWRIEGLERAAEAGIRRLGLGFLLGLADPADDLRALIRHGAYLQQRFPDRTLAFSLPRIHDAPDTFDTLQPVDDDAFIRMYCALRVAFPKAELVLSTREPGPLRDRLARVCITQLSAGSSTAPGGYECPADDARCEPQFPVSDQRTPREMAERLSTAGFEVTWNVDGPSPPTAHRCHAMGRPTNNPPVSTAEG